MRKRDLREFQVRRVTIAKSESESREATELVGVNRFKN